MLLTDEEKREARATDLRAAEILDRVETMPPEVFRRLHGAVRSLTPVAPATAAPVAASERPAWWQEGADDGFSPSTDTVLVDGVALGGAAESGFDHGDGCRRPGHVPGRTDRRSGRVFHDVDGSVHLAVTLDDDPASELHTWYGRFHYFRPDELEPLEPEPLGPARSPGRAAVTGSRRTPRRQRPTPRPPAAEADDMTTDSSTAEVSKEPSRAEDRRGIDEIHILWISEGMSCDGDTVSLTAVPALHRGPGARSDPGLPKVNLVNKVLSPSLGGEDFLAPYRAAVRGDLTTSVHPRHRGIDSQPEHHRGRRLLDVLRERPGDR